MKRHLVLFLLIFPLSFAAASDLSRSSGLRDESDRHFTTMDGNRVHTLVYNYGSVGRPMAEPSLEWPAGTGQGYGFEFGLMVGARVTGHDGQPLIFMNESMLVGGVSGDGGNNWQPLAGYAAAEPNTQIARSDDPSTWPETWESWSGIDENGVLADLEATYVMDDRSNTRHANAYTAMAADSSYAGAGIRVQVRHYQWSSAELEDVLLCVYDVANISDHAFDSVVVGMRGDPHLGGAGDYYDDNVGFIDLDGYDPFTGQTLATVNNLIYGWDTDGVGDTHFGEDAVGVFGIHLVHHNEDDFFRSLLVPAFTTSSYSEDVWWTRFTQTTIDTSAFYQDGDNLMIWGSDFFSLAPGEQRLMFVAFVFGENMNDLLVNTAAIDNTVAELFSGFVSVEGESEFQSPATVHLVNAYPNPFNPTTEIHYDLRLDQRVQVTIYDLNGRLVKTVLNEHQSHGHHSLTWHGTDDLGNPLASGIYLVQLVTAEETHSRKLMLIK